MSFAPTIGLEVHTQLGTKTKLFCSDKNDPDETTPNVNTCPVCMGHPGTLPVLNQEAVKKIVQAGMALSCQINQFSKFDRKNYFYPDLPKGYQISQYDIPFCVSGKLVLSSEKEIRIRRIHLEEDTGRLVHEARKKTTSYKLQVPTFQSGPRPTDVGATSLIDFNRAGVPLMELVTEPDFTSSDEVLEFAKELQLLWRYLGISDADMEKGEMRVEANISLSQLPANLGTKVELKNLNSFKAVKEGIAYEIKRQTQAIKDRKKIVQETRGWNPMKKETFSQREKETEMDYRYFPEPDLPPVVLRDETIEEWRRAISELPWERKTRFIKEYGLPLSDAVIFVEQKELGEYFEQAASELARWERDVERKDVVKEHIPRLLKLAANYLITELPRIALELQATSYKSRRFSRDPDPQTSGLQAKITPENFAELIVLTHSGQISSSAAQTVLLDMAKRGGDPTNIIEEKGLTQVSDQGKLENVVREIIRENEKAVQDYKKGKAGAVQFLIGKAMAKSKGKANPQVLKELLQKFL